MGKIIKRFQKENVVVKMSRQRSKYGKGMEYALWVEIQDKNDAQYGWEQDPNIIQEKTEAEKKFEEIAKAMRDNLEQAVYVYAPQIQHHL